MNNLVKRIEFTSFDDDRGSLVTLEATKTVPFDIKRVYYIFDTKLGVARGFHAHKALKQVAVCLTGSCSILLDDGQNKEEVILDSPKEGLLIEGLVWREMHGFTPDCVLMVLASEYYDEADYIRNYDDFLRVAYR